MIAAEFLFFIVKLNFERYVALFHLKPCQNVAEKWFVTNKSLRQLYEFCTVAALHRPVSVENFSTIHAAKFPIKKEFRI